MERNFLPIDIITWFDRDGHIHPVRFRMDLEDGDQIIVPIDRVLKVDEARLGGNPMLVFCCRSHMFAEEFKVKYELSTRCWFLQMCPRS